MKLFIIKIYFRKSYQEMESVEGFENVENIEEVFQEMGLVEKDMINIIVKQVKL